MFIEIPKRSKKLQERREQPFRFNPEQFVYVYGWTQDFSVRIVRRSQNYLWPAYEVEDINNERWEVSQLLLSTKPIQNRYEDPAND
jgi:hypothetical protein